MVFETGEYKGNKLIVLKRNEDDNYPFRFGYFKAMLILEHIDDIKKWVKENKPKDWSSGIYKFQKRYFFLTFNFQYN